MGSEITRNAVIASLERAIKLYQRYYTEGSRTRRFLRYPIKSGRRLLAKKIKQWSDRPTQIRTCWGKKLFLLLPDKNAGSLFYFGSLGQQDHLLSLYLAQSLQEDDVFYDIGANYGFYSALARAIAKKGEIHSFEPHPLLIECIRKSFPDGVYINQCALSKEIGQAVFYNKYQEGHSGGSTIVKAVGEDGDGMRDTFVVPTMSLDVYTSNHTIPTVLKIDVEGAEYLALQGGVKTLETYRPRIIMEVWGGALWNAYSRSAVELIFQCNYKAYAITKNGALTPISQSELQLLSLKTKYNNIVFLP